MKDNTIIIEVSGGVVTATYIDRENLAAALDVLVVDHDNAKREPDYLPERLELQPLANAGPEIREALQAKQVNDEYNAEMEREMRERL